jgi:hypothetical protein
LVSLTKGLALGWSVLTKGLVSLTKGLVSLTKGLVSLTKGLVSLTKGLVSVVQADLVRLGCRAALAGDARVTRSSRRQDPGWHSRAIGPAAEARQGPTTLGASFDERGVS